MIISKNLDTQNMTSSSQQDNLNHLLDKETDNNCANTQYGALKDVPRASLPSFQPVTPSALTHLNLTQLMLCILYLKSMHKTVYNKKLINVDCLMLRSLQETKCDASLLLLLLQSTQTKFKQQQPQQQQKTTQFQCGNSTKASRLHFSDLQLIYICIYASYICYS